MRAPTPGISLSGIGKSGAGMADGCQIIRPSPYPLLVLLPALQAILASWRLAAKPIEQVIQDPIVLAIRRLILMPRARGSLRSAICTLQVSSSMDLIASIGLTAAISETSALCARRYKSGFCGTS